MRPLSLLVSLLLSVSLVNTACSGTGPEGVAQIPGQGSVRAVVATGWNGPAARGTVAILPDRGDLLGYPSRHAVRQERASTWHRANISEEHAVRAVVTGEMTVTAPDGEAIHLRYQRHFEHPNGNWTWIGQDEHGGEAIVTFGEKAVFGTIPRADGEELSIATSGGQSWVVVADPNKQHHPDTARPDYLVPPELVKTMASEPVTASASVEPISPLAVGTTVDVALGYTTGFASELGGNSQAVTRLQNLVDVTNQAYSNSHISARIRLIATVAVNYPDANDNNVALEKLSGYESGTGSVPVDPAFNALRAARDRYGADLVSLVRRFRTPENNGCGVAWLIGGDQTSINSSDAPWAYSVVSDDLDRGDFDETDKKTYVCRRETLAHELGHNMGQAHNSADSDGTSGAHSYSYGYREASTTGFYTVMAYRLVDSSQKAIRYFANPNVLDAATGRPTGVANASDNTRSMAQTMPLIAAFRSTLVAAAKPGDFNGDGAADIFWRNGVNGSNTIWRSANVATPQTVSTVGDQAWKVARVGDFDGDGRSDVLWRNSANGGNTIWRSGNSATPLAVGTVALAWRVAGAGDFDGDGRDDILWRNADGRNVIWRSGSSATPQAVAASASSWDVAGVGDFNADGLTDILWRNGVDGRNVVWRSGNSAAVQPVQMAATSWRVAAIGDFDGDGHSDILWRNAADGRNVIWRSAIASATLPVATVGNQAWKVAKAGDFDGDGRTDILWRLEGNGQNVVWRSANSATPLAVAAAASAWLVSG
jgi:peptidyl-Asp metalloendopeptidase